MIFVPNHHSHLDTGLMIRSIPRVFRRHLVVAAAADYFFDARWKAVMSALTLNAVPIDRDSGGRKSADLLKELLDDGWSLVIYPGGRALTRRVGSVVQGRRRLPRRPHRRDRRSRPTSMARTPCSARA
ncbi:MAG: 1-acyl-sn-glycerol-3-phosphate acyltransferase [Ilumatobacteraceae bacterium]